MIEIWTEDSTAGYNFVKKINKTKFNRQLKVVPHYGIGEMQPTKTLIHGGILYHLKHLQAGSGLVLLFIDKAIDKAETAVHYQDVIVECRKHKNVKIIEQTCFEILMLSYNKLFNISGNNNINLQNITNEFVQRSQNLKQFRPYKFSNNLKNYMLSHNLNKYHCEYLSKIMLSDITSVNTIYANCNHQLSLISGSTIGPCWMKSCCVIPNQHNQARKCNLPHPVDIDEKINDLITYSLWNNVINQINYYIQEYINENYNNSSGTSKEETYRQMYLSRSKNKLLKHVCSIIDTQGYWNYERLYNRYR